ncbi:bifunctional acetyl-CoA hydrolase/transferase family protein/GNAT family N-acetyltransferase [Desulfosediminicola ganghwensis]|uniref:bifunctional acetyl-CoA hydrolase/transferase family protein/GNAT family N-acetyltransferase n=1 Tax=Desulfosediminicola ganghwensis TaxID=2569540 RepID=UPI0010ACF5C2|nr:bifunctional acetyl-CoA hydrolase/transferase family protein/GNAT family N-acetyltransferase [Desulfosediminicola ganghwensis]
MAENIYWADTYVQKICSSAQAIRKIRHGQRIFIGSACGEPQELVRALAHCSKEFSGLEIVRMMSMETSSLIDIADQTHDASLNIRSIYLGSTSSESLSRNKRFITPMNMSEVPSLFTSRRMPVNVAMIQVSPPDDFGWMSLGISVDVTYAATLAADFVIAQVNDRMPRVMGHSFIHVNQVDVVVEHNEELLTIAPIEQSETAARIGKQLSRLIEDGSTLQVGLDAASQATVQALEGKNDLGFHSQYLTEDVMHLYSQGVITNRCKGYNDGKLVASAALGSSNLYEFLHDNPGIEFYPSDYVNDPFTIARHNRMVTMNRASAIDLTGQVLAEAMAHTLYAGVSGIPDFVRGARGSKGGKSIIFLPSTINNGAMSAITPSVAGEAVVVPRGDVHFVATEFGVINLFGKSLQERAMALISISHPDFRDELLDSAKEVGLVARDRKLGTAGKAVYPVQLEDFVYRDNLKITIRPAKPVDERRIQEHYYGLDKDDVVRRFFHEKTSFIRSDVETKSQIDYIRELTLIALVGEAGFENVIAIGEYLLEAETNMAEVAFSVNTQYQGLGLGKALLKKISVAARDNGIAGLVAYTVPTNKAMVNLFKSLPYKVVTYFEDDGLKLTCKFDELKEGLE